VFDIDEKRVGPIRYLALNDLSRPEALGLMQHLPNLSEASYEDKEVAYGIFGGHPYGLVTLDRYCRVKSLGEVLKDVGVVHRELREFLVLEMNYGKLTDRGRELLKRLSAFRRPVEWEAVHWVMGEEVDVSAEFMKKLDRSKMPGEFKEMSDEELAQMFKEILPQQRRAEGMEVVVEELVSWGLVSPVREEEEVLLTVHSLVREFCREKSGEEWERYLKEAAGYYTNKYRVLQREQKTPFMVLEEVEAAELSMEAGDFEAAADIIINTTPLMDRWGLGMLLELLYERVVPGVGEKTRAKILHNLAILMQGRGDYASALQQYEQSLKIKEELGDRAGVASTHGQLGLLFQKMGEFHGAFENLMMALAIFAQIGSPDAEKTVENLKKLRDAWGAENFDKAWKKATGEEWDW